MEPELVTRTKLLGDDTSERILDLHGDNITERRHALGEVGRLSSNCPREFVATSTPAQPAFRKRADIEGDKKEGFLHSSADQLDVEVWSNEYEIVGKSTSDQESHRKVQRPSGEQQQHQEDSQQKFLQRNRQESQKEFPLVLEWEDYKKRHGKHYSKKKMRKSRDRGLKKANTGTNDGPGNTSTRLITTRSAPRNIEFQSSVHQLARQWQELNESAPQNQDEVFNLCLTSETLLYIAAKQFKPLQLAVFKRKIRELGGEVEDCRTHYKRACEFGEKVSDRLLESEIDPSSRARVLENLQLLAHLTRISGSLIDISGTEILPREKVFQGRRVYNLIRNTNFLKAALEQSADNSLARLQSLDDHSEGSQQIFGFPRARTLSQSTSDPESDDYEPEDLLTTYTAREKQAGFSSPKSYVKDLKTLLPSTERKGGKADGQFAGALLIDDEEPIDEHLPICPALPLDVLDQNISLTAKLEREGNKFQSLGNVDVTNWDTLVEDITEQDTSVEGSLADNPPVEDIDLEDILDQNTSFDKSSAKDIKNKNICGQDYYGQNKKPVKISLCLNPRTLKPRDRSFFIKEVTPEDTPDQRPKIRELPFKKPTLAMAIAAEVSLPLPPLPTDWSGNIGKDFKAVGNVSASTLRSVEPVGPYYLAHARRARHKRTFSEDDRIQAQESVKIIEDSDNGEISEVEDPAMLLRNAKDWKGQDHYAVLGLSNHRWRATEEQIKRAHRKKVLRHHPDKKAAAGSTEDDSFFKCIQKATEILLDPVKRRQFDSVDEAADIEPPTKKQTQKGNFYKLWGPVFRAEGRFSKIQPVPKLGDENSSKQDVDNFYNFWYNFDSWRSFEYQDEDVPDDNENRDQKRHMERKNNNARKKKKTEDSARLRKLLDDCSTLDERIKKFRQEANASKNKKRLEKEAAEKKAVEEAKAKKEAEEKAAKEAEEAAKVEREQGKKAKEAAKNAVKKNKRVLKASVKDANYFVTGNPPAATIDTVLNDVELVQGKVDPDEIAALAGKLTGLKVSDEIKTVWKDEVKRLVGAGKLKDGDIKTFV